MNNILQYSHVKLPKLFYNYTDLLLSQVNKRSLKGNSESIGSEKSLKSVISQLAFWILVESSGGNGSTNFSNTLRLEWFSFECRKTKTKVITLANHIGHRQYIEPIKTRSNYMWLTQSAGKYMRARHNWLWFYFWLDEKVARIF